jgi:5-methylcytosine-specific restriction endonuclease McrA
MLIKLPPTSSPSRNNEKQIADAKKKLNRRKAVKASKTKLKEKLKATNITLLNNYTISKYVPNMGNKFYSTKEWRELRWQVLSTSTGQCSVCGRSHKVHKVILHVDHILPRSKYPELELSLNNMQVLCEDCNLGKGAKIQTF